jgi:hypothetical protein
VRVGVGVFPQSYPEDGNISSFRYVVICSFWNIKRWANPKLPVILGIIHHRQNRLQSTVQKVLLLKILFSATVSRHDNVLFASSIIVCQKETTWINFHVLYSADTQSWNGLHAAFDSRYLTLFLFNKRMSPAHSRN